MTVKVTVMIQVTLTLSQTELIFNSIILMVSEKKHQISKNQNVKKGNAKQQMANIIKNIDPGELIDIRL